MKILLLITLEIILGLGVSQDRTNFELTKEGVAPITLHFNNQKASQIYKKTINWVYENYPDFKEVLKTNIENKTIQIESYQEKAWYYNGFGFKNEFDMEYSLQVDIQDNEIKLTFTPGQFWVTRQEKAAFDYHFLFDNTGKISWEYKEAKPSMEKTMNDIGTSLVNYIKAK